MESLRDLAALAGAGAMSGPVGGLWPWVDDVHHGCASSVTP